MGYTSVAPALEDLTCASDSFRSSILTPLVCVFHLVFSSLFGSLRSHGCAPSRLSSYHSVCSSLSPLGHASCRLCLNQSSSNPSNHPPWNHISFLLLSCTGFACVVIVSLCNSFIQVLQPDSSSLPRTFTDLSSTDSNSNPSPDLRISGTSSLGTCPTSSTILQSSSSTERSSINGLHFTSSGSLPEPYTSIAEGVCVRVCVRVCVSVCVCECTYASDLTAVCCMQLFSFSRVCVHNLYGIIHTGMYARSHVQTSTHTHRYIHAYTCTHVCTHMHTYTLTHTRTHTHAHARTWAHIHAHPYACTHKLTHSHSHSAESEAPMHTHHSLQHHSSTGDISALVQVRKGLHTVSHLCIPTHAHYAILGCTHFCADPVILRTSACMPLLMFSHAFSHACLLTHVHARTHTHKHTHTHTYTHTHTHTHTHT